MPLRVRVDDIRVIFIKPKISQVIPQFVIKAEDEYGIRETIWVDAPKADKEAITKEFIRRYSRRYGLPPEQIQLVWEVELPRVEKVGSQ